jgi:hypothetical protein
VDPRGEVDGPPPSLLAAYGIEVVPSTRPPRSSGDRGGRDVGYPVALKAAGGACGTASTSARSGWRWPTRTTSARVRELSAAFGPDVLVQTMVPPGVACTRRGGRGPGVRAGGRVRARRRGSELLGDLAWRAAPLTDRAAAALVDEPRAAPLLHGYRGSTPVDRDALIDLLLRVGRWPTSIRASGRCR